MISQVNDRLIFNQDNSIFNNVLNALMGLAVVILFLEIIFSISYSGIYVIGKSMNNTLNGADEYIVDSLYVADASGDYVYVKKNANPDYGDIVVINKDSNTTIIKRVIAKGGDYVKMVKGKVYLKHSADENFPNEPLIEDYVAVENNSPSYSNNTFHNSGDGYYVEEGYYFVLGDNRNVSLDSREDGGTCFTDKQIYGVVTDWSLRGKNFYSRLHRFFSYELPEVFGIDNRIKRQKTNNEV